MPLRYVKAEPIALKNHAEFTEKWLQDRINDDPSILGLGELEVIERERRHEKAGRLDLLLYDRQENTRYETELMLGATDESHIIRCIEYWDIERRRYPAYDHCAVLVAENITSRFLNILSLFAGTIPFIAIQLNALKVGEQIVLDFVRVLDRVGLRIDDEAEGDTTPADRNYWNNRATAATVEVADHLLQIVNQKADPKLQLNFVRHYIGMTDGVRSRNFVYFHPRKQHLYVNADVSDAQKWAGRLSEAGLSAGVSNGNGYLWIKLFPKEVEPNRAVLTEVLHDAAAKYAAD